MTRANRILEETDKKWLRSLLRSGVPADINDAAIRLYELGEKEIGLNALIEQLNQYKDPKAHWSILVKVCPAAAHALGNLGDPGAIDALIEALDVYSTDAAIALSSIDGDALKARLRQMAKIDNMSGFGATIALGYMRDADVLPSIMDIVRHRELYEEKYLSKRRANSKIPWTYRDVLCMLGNYAQPDAEKLFLQMITRDDIRWLVMNYALIQGLKVLPRKGYGFSTDVVRKFGWDKFVSKPEIIKMLTASDLQKSDKEIDAVVDLIWAHVKETNKN